MRGWKPTEAKEFQDQVDARIAKFPSPDEAEDTAQELEKKCKYIEAILVEVAAKCHEKLKSDEQSRKKSSDSLHRLIDERRVARRARCKEAVRDISKRIKKEIQAVAKARKSARISKILDEFKDLQRVADVRGGGKRPCISSVLDQNGSEKTGNDDIAEVFAAFFESLYAGNGSEHNYIHDGDLEPVDDVSVEEIRTQLKKMKSRKAADEGGVVAELLFYSSDSLLRVVADIFTAVLKPHTTVPEYWKASSIRVLFKKGDDRYPENYRPICIIPILYKLFSRVLCARIKDRLNSEQCSDQAGFRPNYSCDDHLFAITLLSEKCNEFNVPLWTATLDFKKAFDSITHASIWKALIAQRVPCSYVHMLSRLYEGQLASVKVDSASLAFQINKGTKQGDPISPMIFNAVLEDVMRKVKAKWERSKYGMQLGHIPQTMITNLRFADDIILVGRSLPQIKRMLADVASEGARVGLQLHPDKTKIQHNNIGYGSKVRSAKVHGMSIEILDPSASTMYLGRALSLTDTHDVELQHRIRRAWAKLGIFKSELPDRDIPLHLRVKLFKPALTPTILYGCCSWVLTNKQEDTFKATQMKMLRAILGRKRLVNADRDTETWVEWVKRVTAEARQIMHTHSIPDWVEEQRSKVHRWNESVNNLDSERWTQRVLNWRPEGCRSRGHL